VVFEIVKNAFLYLDPADLIPKQNGVKESLNKSSSSFVSHPPSTNDDDDDSNLIIGSTILPTNDSLLIESKEINNDDQLEIVSSPQTKKTISKETIVPEGMENTPPPPVDDPQPTNMETAAPAMCPDTVDKEMDDLSPRPASEKLETLPTSELAEQIQEADNITDDSTPRQQVNVTIDQEAIKQAVASEQMDTGEFMLKQKSFIYLFFFRIFIHACQW
jgi:hypothetical protein